MTRSWGLHWFRRDLRVWGNPALQKNVEKHAGRVLGIFCFDPKYLSRADFSENRFSFFLKSLKALKSDLQESGGDLLVLDSHPDEAFRKLFSALNRSGSQKSSLSLQTLSYNRDYEPFARERDDRLVSFFEDSQGLAVISERDHLLFEPHEITKPAAKGASDFYSIFTPYARRALDALNSPLGQSRILEHREGLVALASPRNRQKLFAIRWAQVLDVAGSNQAPELRDVLEEYDTRAQRETRISMPPAGSESAFKALSEFKSRLGRYEVDRNVPSVQGTSRLSHYIKNGSLCTSQIILHLELYKERKQKNKAALQFLKELLWREFYYYILWHRPEVETDAFRPQYRRMEWRSDARAHADFERWCQGKTGFPIVDAGMRELNTTGFMHNRVRMIVASFLTKDLHLDWRWGENYFMQKLFDGDLASNNGGWQWAASTGCDAQPYFRVFNPALQSQRFDPDGIYIKKFVPELASVAAKLIHSPPPTLGYPAPMVDHAKSRLEAIELYRRKPAKKRPSSEN